MTDPIYQAELDHDSGFSEKQLESFRQEALDLLIDRLFEGNSVGGFHLDAYIEQFASEISAEFIRGESQDRFSYIRSVLESLIRRELEGSDALHERAAELAQGE